MIDMSMAYLALGSNQGDRQKNLETAIAKIQEKIGPVKVLSSFIETFPVGFSSEHLFLNAAVGIDSDLSLQKLLPITRLIEKEMGRITKSHNREYHDRIIDIDILFYDDLIFHNEELTVPHAHLQERLFVLQPMAEIAPDFVHPLIGKTMQEMFLDLKAETCSFGACFEKTSSMRGYPSQIK